VKSRISFRNWTWWPDRGARGSLVWLLAVASCGCTPSVHLTPREEVQLLLIQQAQAQFADGHYEAAVHTLRRVVETSPPLERLVEAHWWLARAYEQAGDYRAALAEYRQLLALSEERSTPGPYTAEAVRRLASLEQRLGALAQTSRGLVGVQLSPQAVPEMAALEEWLDGLVRAGVSVLVLDAGTYESSSSRASRAGVFFRTTRAPVLRDVFDYAVPAAHRHGLAVFAAVSLRRMDWIDPSLGWNDVVLDEQTGRLNVSSSLDLFHPAFQDYLMGFLEDLAATGIDGILFRAEPPSGPLQGFSPYGLRRFEQEVGVRFDPTALTLPERDGRMVSVGNEFAASRPEYWRWLGWKAREAINVLGRLRRAIRQRVPLVQFALEVHPEAVADPVTALVQYGEDLLEAKAARFDRYVTAEGPPPVPFVTVPAPGTVPVIVRPSSSFLARAVELIGQAEAIWLAKPLGSGDPLRPWTRLAPEANHPMLESGLGVLYLERPLERS
jgi:hypothetical protein